MTILLINELFYQSTVFILFCKILACFWLMDLAPSTYFWLFPATFFKPYPHEWGQLDPGFLPQRLFALCVGNLPIIIHLFPLLLSPSLSWGSNLGPLAHQASSLPLSCISSPSACLSVLGVLVVLPLVSSCVCLCVFLQWAALCWDLSMLACLWLDCLFRAWNLLRLLQTSADYFLQPYNRCPPHGTSQSWMTKKGADSVPRP